LLYISINVFVPYILQPHECINIYNSSVPGNYLLNFVQVFVDTCAYIIFHQWASINIRWFWFGLVYGVLRHFQQYLSYIVEVSGNWRKPPISRKSLTNVIT